MGIGSGHRRVPNTRQDDVESKMLDKISHGGASTVDKSTTGRFPYQQSTFLKGLKVKIRANRALARDRRKDFPVFSRKQDIARISREFRDIKKTENVKKYENYLLVRTCAYGANKKRVKNGIKGQKG